MESFVTESRNPVHLSRAGASPLRPRSRSLSPPARRPSRRARCCCTRCRRPATSTRSSQGAIVFSGPDFSVSARPWDYRLVAEEFRRAGEPCPFGEDDAAVGRFLFFRVRLENRSTRTLVFNPMRASLLREGEAPRSRLENSDLFAFTGETRPPRRRAAGPSAA